MNTRKLGKTGPTVSSIGLGCMGLSTAYGAPKDKSEAITLLRSAFDRGVTLFDTAAAYGPFENEKLLGEALTPIRDEVVLATKFGYEIIQGSRIPQLDSRPEAIRRSVDEALSRLRTDRIDIYFQHRVDPQVPIEDVAGAVAELVALGKVLHFGLSEPGLETLRRAHAVHPVAAVQSEYSLWWREPEAGLLELLQQLGIGFICSSPLGKGFLTGTLDERSTFEPTDHRNSIPRFLPENRKTNLALVDVIRSAAAARGATPAQIALAWLLVRGPSIVPIPGTTRLARIHENLGAAEIRLTEQEVTELTRRLDELEIAGGRATAGLARMAGR
jgi:aryl-alcohol dehydrogenase-like predicted oxidoreductase